WLQQVAIAVEKDGRLDEGLTASEIVDICHGRGIEFPNKIYTSDLNQLSMYAGRLLGRLFGDLSTDEPLKIDRHQVTYDTRKQYRPPREGGDYLKRYYWFARR